MPASSGQNPQTSAQTENSDAEIFLAFHYTEIKDLSKHFLTLVSGILAFSVTFSEKVIGLTQANRLETALLITSWTFLVIAIVASGFGIYSDFYAASQAKGAIITGNRRDFKPYVRRAYAALRVAGIAFVLGLVLLALAGVSKVIQ